MLYLNIVSLLNVLIYHSLKRIRPLAMEIRCTVFFFYQPLWFIISASFISIFIVHIITTIKLVGIVIIVYNMRKL